MVKNYLKRIVLDPCVYRTFYACFKYGKRTLHFSLCRDDEPGEMIWNSRTIYPNFPTIFNNAKTNKTVSMVGFFSNISFCFNKQKIKLMKTDATRNAPALFDGFPVKKDGSFTYSESGAVHGVLDYQFEMSC